MIFLQYRSRCILILVHALTWQCRQIKYLLPAIRRCHFVWFIILVSFFFFQILLLTKFYFLFCSLSSRKHNFFFISHHFSCSPTTQITVAFQIRWPPRLPPPKAESLKSPLTMLTLPLLVSQNGARVNSASEWDERISPFQASDNLTSNR